jgi:hypothetical protein
MGIRAFPLILALANEGVLVAETSVQSFRDVRKRSGLLFAANQELKLQTERSLMMSIKCCLGELDPPPEPLLSCCAGAICDAGLESLVALLQYSIENTRDCLGSANLIKMAAVLYSRNDRALAIERAMQITAITIAAMSAVDRDIMATITLGRTGLLGMAHNYDEETKQFCKRFLDLELFTEAEINAMRRY